VNERLPQKFASYVDVFSNNDWQELDRLVDELLTDPCAKIEIPQHGDSRNEAVTLKVARLIVRENNCSSVVNEPFTTAILNILLRAKFVEKMQHHTGLKNLKILRMQLNAMGEAAFVGIHTDQESDPAYVMTSIIRTTSSFSNGELVLYRKKPELITQPSHSVFLMDATIEHEVKSVTSGYRNSIIAVLGIAA
jgi:hypothetical protein